jgi:hypothetical protein
MRIFRLTIFNHLWAIAGFCEWSRWKTEEPGPSWGLLAVTVLLFIFPNSSLTLAAFAMYQFIFAVFLVDTPWNHGLMMAFMNAGILLSMTWIYLEGKNRLPDQRISWDPDRLVDTFGPLLRMSLIIVYLFTFFHKVNADFVNPDVSCAGVVLSWINRSYRILPLQEWAIIVSIWTTLAVELIVPILLLFRRTLYSGLILGAGFHLFLSQYGGLHGFAAMIIAAYFLFLPEGFTRKIAGKFEKMSDHLFWPKLQRYGLPLLVLLLLVSIKFLTYFFHLTALYAGLFIWDIWLIAVLLLFGRELLAVRHTPATYTLRPRQAILWIIPLIAFINGLSPYLGLKTETSWAMYSNLRTEIKPNHFLIPPAIKVFGYQDDLVEIVDSSLPELQSYAKPEKALVYFEFRRICSLANGDFQVSYRRNGKAEKLTVIDGVSSNPELTHPNPWLLGKLLKFRPVDTGEHANCQH